MQTHGFTLVGGAAGHGAEVRGQEDPVSRIPPCLLPGALLGSHLDCARVQPWRQVSDPGQRARGTQRRWIFVCFSAQGRQWEEGI